MSDPSAVPSASLPSFPPLLARAMRPLPLLPLELVLGGLMQRICARHPRMFDRLGVHAAKRFGIRPTDLPFTFVIVAHPRRPRLVLVREMPADLDACISSSLANLLALAEGRVDGDALMFSRQLVIEGDVEAVLALRNAIDDAALDLVAEVAGMFGPLGDPIQKVLERARGALLKPTRLSEETTPWS